MLVVTLTINGKRIEAEEGTCVLQAGLDNGIEIPHICWDKRLDAYGGCRMCLVEIEGMPEPVTSCTTLVREGMVVRSDTERLEKTRKALLELLLYDHPRSCLTCPQTGTCTLQDSAYDAGIEEFPAGEHEKPLLRELQDVGNAVIYRDPAKCILCGKCVRICHEVRMNGCLDFAGRGFDTIVHPPKGGLTWDSDCELCGACVDICPTGALNVTRSLNKGRPKDWTQVETTCPYCGVGCQMTLNVHNDEVVRVTSDTEKLPTFGNLCVKGRFGYEFINSPDRLQQPMVRKGDELVETSWDEALGTAADALKRIVAEHGPNSVGFVSSCRCTNEENYLMQRMSREIFGTHNIDQCARTCHAPTVAGLAMSFGSGAMTNSIGEIQNCEVLFIIGSNTTEAHPVIALEMKKAYKRGAKIIVCDPRRIKMVDYATIHIQHRPGTDIPLINAMMNYIISEGLHAQEYIENRTMGFEELAETVSKYDIDEVAEQCGVDAELIKQAARTYAEGDKSAIFYTLGITEHTCGTDNVRSLANLSMLTGHVGFESTGVNPLRGQNNVQGGCDMGAMPNAYPGYQKVVDPEAAAKFSEAYGRELPAENGWTTTEMLNRAKSGEIKALVVMGEDIVMSEPFMDHTREACANLEMLVCMDIFMCETAKISHVVLPAASFAEKDGTFTNTERRVQRVRAAVSPVGNSRPDWVILCDLAKKLGYDWSYSHASEVWDELAALSPIFAGINYDRIDKHGLQWPCRDCEDPGTQFLHCEEFACGLGRFYAIDHRDPAEMPDDEYPLIMMTGRTLYHYNVGTMTRQSAASNERQPECFVEISPEDGAGMGVATGDKVKVTTRRGEIEVTAWVTDRLKGGRIWLPFHFAEQAANELTIDAFDNITETAEYKVCAARVAPADVAAVR